MNIYYENQNGGLCRLHSLNAFFNKKEITEELFKKFQEEYDKVYKKKFNCNISCKNFDFVACDQNNIIGFILKKYGVYTRYYAINELFGKDIEKIIKEILYGDFFFQYTENHIYGARLNNNVFYNVDSINGISILHFNILKFQKNIGFIIPVDIKKEFYHNVKKLKDIIKIPTKNEIEKYLILQNKNKNILGEIEIPLGICIDILETQLSKKKDIIYIDIYKNVKKYNDFLGEFTKGQYNNIKLIIDVLPDIIFSLIKLNIIN